MNDLFKKYKVLHAEDEPLITDVCKEALRFYSKKHSLDIEYITVPNGQEVIKYLTEISSDINLLILDIYMPVMDGFQTAEIIHHSQWEGIFPVVFYSAYYSSSAVTCSYVNEFIVKAASIRPFLGILDNYLKLH